MPKILFTQNQDLARDKSRTSTTEDVVAGGTTLRLQSIVGFESIGTSSGQIVCIGEIGNERTELLRTTNASGYVPSPTYQEITLRNAMAFDHPQDTPIYIIDWNRIETQWASTATGTKSTLTAYPQYIDPGQRETVYKDTSQTAGYYFQRFNETVGDTNSDWSDPIPYSGYDDNMVFAIKKRALDELGETIDDKVITHEFLNQTLWEARREYHQARGKRPFRRKFNADIGNAATGSAKIELPTDAERPFTAENIYGVRIGTEANMEYYDKKQWDLDYRGISHSTLDVAYVRGSSTSLWIVNGRDFSDSAIVNVEGQSIKLTRIAGLTGDSYYNTFRIYEHPSTSVGWNSTIGSDVWENASFGLPDKFTVFATPGGSAYIHFNKPIDTAYVGQNIYLDYYRTLLGYDSDYDLLDEPKYDFFVHYLKAKIRHKKSKGTTDLLQDSDYKIWLAMKQEALDTEVLGSEITIVPEISHLALPE